MSISRRLDKDGKIVGYTVRVEWSDPVTHKRERITVGTFATLREAKAAERKGFTERDTGTLLSKSTATVGDLLDKYMEMHVSDPEIVRPENRQGYEIIIDKHLKPALGNIRAQDLTVEQVDKFYSELRKRGYSSSLVKKCHMRLSAAMRQGRRWGIVARNVCEDANIPKVSYRQATIWTPDEVASFLAIAETDKLYPLWLLMVETGARTSEALGITWDDVNFERSTLRLGAQVVRLDRGTPIIKHNAKTEAGNRTIRLTAGTLATLRPYRTQWIATKLASGADWNPGGLVFVTPAGHPINARNLRRAFDKVVKSAGVRPISPHTIRKTHITQTIANGAPVKAVAARVGHKDITTTLATYTALTASMDDQLMGIVESIIPQRKEHAG